ncbi:MAG: cytidylate kinase-like family protein [Deltaproteobacteria bacterium]|nr:cytidylate kinase-like family protein [Deltaproteobacteria bacterium]
MGKAITISRNYGCGGIELARSLAEDLGYEYIDKTLVVELARKMHTSEGEISSYEDGTSIPLFRFISTFMTSAKVKSILSDDFGYVDEDSYRLALEGLMDDLADRGDVVIVGRGGQCILHDRPDVVHLRLIAPMDYKKKFLASKLGVPKEEAGKMIDHKEQERRRYIKVMFDRDNEEASLYHIIMNLALVDQDTAKEIIKKLL